MADRIDEKIINNKNANNLNNGLIKFYSKFNKIFINSNVFSGKLLFLFAIILVLVVQSVSAIGITPGRTNIDYEPGKSRTVEFTVVNTEGKDIEGVILVQGELNRSISVSEVSFKMSVAEREKKFSYVLAMPNDLRPGTHAGEVVAIQLPSKSSEGETFIGSAIGVATQVHIFVPYPGKYAEAEMSVIGPGNNGKIIFSLPVASRGELDLVRVRGTVDIYTSLNEKIATVITNEVSILSKERKEITAEWDSSSANPGPYRAVATVLYDEESFKIEKEFNVGQQKLDVESIEVNDFSLGQIAKFEILVNNKWSQKITGAYAQMIIYNDKKEAIADFKSQTYDFSPLEKTLMVAFWDTAGVKKGAYESSLFLKYASNSEQRDFKLEVSESEIKVVGIGYVISKGAKGSGGSTLTTVLIVGIVVLVLINLVWFLVLRKKLAGKK